MRRKLVKEVVVLDSSTVVDLYYYSVVVLVIMGIWMFVTAGGIAKSYVVWARVGALVTGPKHSLNDVSNCPKHTQIMSQKVPKPHIIIPFLLEEYKHYFLAYLYIGRYVTHFVVAWVPHRFMLLRHVYRKHASKIGLKISTRTPLMNHGLKPQLKRIAFFEQACHLRTRPDVVRVD